VLNVASIFLFTLNWHSMNTKIQFLKDDSKITNLTFLQSFPFLTLGVIRVLGLAFVVLGIPPVNLQIEGLLIQILAKKIKVKNEKGVYLCCWGRHLIQHVAHLRSHFSVLLHLVLVLLELLL
jgi:hypothetical protein